MRVNTKETRAFTDPYKRTSDQLRKEWQTFETNQKRRSSRELIGALLFGLLITVIFFVLVAGALGG